MARAIRRIGTQKKMPFHVRLAAMMASLAEASGANQYGDGGAALGPFQIHPEHIGEHGLKDRTSISQSIKWWFGEAKRVGYKGKGLAELAQDVERSANSSGSQYAAQESKARGLFKSTRGPKDDKDDPKDKDNKKKTPTKAAPPAPWSSEAFTKAFGYDPFTLGGLENVGGWHIGGVQKILEGLDNEGAIAALDSPPWEDDLNVGQRLVTLWESLYALTQQRGTLGQQAEAATKLKEVRDNYKQMQETANAPPPVPETSSALDDFYKQLYEGQLRLNATMRSEQTILSPSALKKFFVGSFAAGGVIPATGMAMVHKGETVLPAGSGGGISVNIYADEYDPYARIEVMSDGQLQAVATAIMRKEGRRAALSRQTPQAGRKA